MQFCRGDGTGSRTFLHILRSLDSVADLVIIPKVGLTCKGAMESVTKVFVPQGVLAAHVEEL